MFYERKVIYLDYLVNKECCGNAGFLKIEARGTVCNLTINVSNPRPVDSFPLKVYLIGGGQERELCRLDFVQGRCMKQLLKQDMHDIGRTGIAYESLDAVRIPISEEREIYGVIREHREVLKVVGQERDAQNNASVRELSVKMQKDDIEVQETTTDNKDMQEDSVRSIIEKFEECVHVDKKVTQPTVEQDASIDAAERNGEDNMQRDEMAPKFPLLDDKWKQLWAIYPHVAPFRDEREYLSVGPNDFVILPGKYFKMANNSFLLHGYHNYKHLILKKMEYRGEVRYYIGVPGNFYDREKQVAIMFGFESFESLEEPAQTGDYGYYLMRIEL